MDSRAFVKRFILLKDHMVYFARIPLLIELGRLCLEYNKHELAADCLENLKGGVKVILSL